MLHGSVYAQIPFSINSTLILPAHVSPQVQVQWYRNGAIIEQQQQLGNSFYNIATVLVNSTHAESSLLITEPYPALGVRYTCLFTAILYGIEIFTVNKSTDSKDISSEEKQY